MDHAGGHPFGSSAVRGAAGPVTWTPKQSGAGMPQGDSDVEVIGNGGCADRSHRGRRDRPAK